MRAVLFRLAFYAGLGALAAGLFRTQVLEGGRYRVLSEKNRVRLIPLEAPRGRVFDAKGRLLATNRPSFDVVAMPEDVRPETFARLAALLKLPEREIRSRMSAPREYPFAPALILEDVPRELAFEIEERRPELAGVGIQVSFLRFYPYQETASHLIGFIGKIGPEEYKGADRERFGMNSLVGRTGIEKIYDGRLRGWRGGRQIEVNARGDLVRVLSEKIPEPGEDLTVTLDLDIQQKVNALIEGKRAAVAVLDLENEGLLVMASSPGFDPNVFVSPGHGRDRMRFLKDEAAPLLDRSIGSAYPPGSVFKLVTAITGLETGKITPETRFFCHGQFRLKPHARPYHCWFKQGHGGLNLYEALERSCNVYFYNVASRLSAEEIAHFSRLLGLGEPPAFGLEATPGLVPDADWKQKTLGERWYQGETLSFGIGQSYLLVSPMQILRLVSIIAQDGKRVEPHFLVEKAAGPRPRVAVHAENLEAIKRGMLQVVESKYGTGQLARLDFAKLAAKTGTAQAPPKDPHSWMTGFFPYEHPRYAFVVFVEHGGSGGLTCAKIVKQMLQLWRDDVPKLA